MRNKKSPAVPEDPGMAFINHFMPNATDEEKEEAYRNLEGLLEVPIGIDDRLKIEQAEPLP